MARNRPRPLDKFVWVEHESGKQRRILRARLPSLSPQWKRIADPTKKAETEAESVPKSQPVKKAQSRPASTSAE